MSLTPRRRASLHLAVVGMYALLAVLLTWPLVRHLTTHVPGSYTWAFDEYTFVWNTWWLRYSLFDLGQNPLVSAHIFYPLGIDLVLYTYNLFNALISLPLQPFLSLVTISNLTFLLATVLSAYGTFLLLEYLLAVLGATSEKTPSTRARYIAALLAGLLYAFGSYRLVYAAIGHYDMWSTSWIPFYALYLIKTIREHKTKNAVLAGIFMVLALLCEMIFGVFLAMLTALLLVFVIGQQRRQIVAGGWAALLRRLLILALVATLLYLPMLVPILGEMFGGYELAGWGDAEKLSADLVGLVTPTSLHPLGGDWAETLHDTREGTSRFRDVNTLFLGWAGLALALIGAIRYRRQLAAWITSLVVFATFSLGPLLQINGRSMFDLDGLLVNVPLPFILLHYLPVVKANRVPNRFGVVLMLALAVLAAFGAYWLLSKLRRSWLLMAPAALLFVGLVLFEHWSVPLPLTDARIPEVYEQVAAEPGDFAILQLPMGWRNSFGVQGAENTQTQYFQTYHRKRLLSGNISRNPPIKFDYFRRVPILDSLITIENYGQVGADRRQADRETAGGFVAFYDIRYVVVAPAVPGRPPYADTRDETVAYIEEVLPVVKIHDRQGWLLYRVDQSRIPAGFEVDLGVSQPEAAMVLGEGWAEEELIQGKTGNWAVAQNAQFFLPADDRADYHLEMVVRPFEYPDAQPQAVALSVNGQELEQLPSPPGWNSISWDVPAQLLRAGLNELHLQFVDLTAPYDVFLENAAIGSTGVRAPLSIQVTSSGTEEVAFIVIGTGSEAKDGSRHHPGYNVAVIDSHTGRLRDLQFFDTTPRGSQAKAAELAEYLLEVPEGQIVAVVLQGEGAVHLTEEAVAALRQVGAQVDLRGTTGWSHAIIGVKGATPGTAMEVAGAENAYINVAPDRRTLAIAVDTILWQRKE